LPGAAAGAGGIGLGTVGIIAAAGVAGAFAFSQTASGPKAGPGAFTPTLGAAFAPGKAGGWASVDWAKVAGDLDAAANGFTDAADAAEKAQQARNAAFTSNPTRAELRVKVRDLQKLKPTKDTERAIKSLQNRLQNRIDAEKKRVSDAIDASARGIVAAVKAAGSQPIYVTVPVTTNFNSRQVEANLNRYTYLPGQGITKTSGFLP
jgi:hypothetical protein